MERQRSNWPLALTVAGAITILFTIILDRHLTMSYEGSRDTLTSSGQIFLVALMVFATGATLLIDRLVRFLLALLREPNGSRTSSTGAQNGGA